MVRDAWFLVSTEDTILSESAELIFQPGKLSIEHKEKPLQDRLENALAILM